MYAYGLGMTLEASLLLSPGGGLSDTELAAWSGLQTWLDPKYLASLTMGAASTLVDADMSDAGTGAWTPVSGAVLSKVAGPKLRVAGGICAARQLGVVVEGNRYAWQGTYNGDGAVAYPRTAWSSGTIVTSGTTSTSTQAYSASSTCDTSSAGVVLYCWSTPTSGYTEFGALSVTNISLTSIAPRAGALASAFTQATAANMPWIDSTTGAIRFDGTADYVQYSGAASAFDFIHTGEMEIIAVGNFDNTTGLRPVLGNYNTVGLALRNATGTTSLQALVTNDGGTVTLTSSAGVITAGTRQIYGARKSGTTITISANGTDVATDTLANSTGAASSALKLGTAAGTNYFAGTMGDVLIFNRVLTDLERARLTRKLATKWGIAI